jgi:hypothetical protein
MSHSNEDGQPRLIAVLVVREPDLSHDHHLGTDSQRLTDQLSVHRMTDVSVAERGRRVPLRQGQKV